MQLYPAIDLKEGQCVRLKQGQFQEITVYSGNPEKVAEYWESRGASYLHLVDLDGALAGKSVNQEAIRKIVKSVGIPVELGGGIRSREAVERLLGIGVARVIIGTRAAENPRWMEALVREFGPEHIVAGVDAREGFVATDGWEKTSRISASELCLQMKRFGVRHVVYTDISRDGMLSGPNVECTKKLTEETGLDVIASGGVSSVEDLISLARAGIQGAIIGKALYERRIDLEQAIALLEREGGV